MIGSVQKVLVENKAKKGDNLFGRTENMRNTHFKGDESLIGQIVNVKITDAINIWLILHYSQVPSI
jgi:tRNA-2-methylthio-N6-dimethylallyladenosine synthase